MSDDNIKTTKKTDKLRQISQQIGQKIHKGITKFGVVTLRGSKVLARKGVEAGRIAAGKFREEIEYRKQLSQAEREAYRKARLDYAKKFGQARAEREFQEKITMSKEQKSGFGAGAGLPIFEKKSIPLFEPNKTQRLPIFELKEPKPSRKKLKKVRGLAIW